MASASTELMPGWSAKLDRDTAAGTARSVTWTAAPNIGIAPDQFALFRVAVTLPNTDTVSFPVTQTYNDGTVVHWDQPPLPGGGEPEHPAPMLTLTTASSTPSSAAAAVLMTVASASAHATRIATDPPVNAVLATGPSQVSATFNEHLRTTFAAMTVVGPDGNLWSTGEPRVEGAVISVDVMPLGPAGTYTVNYRVTSADGHVVSGSWPFQLTPAGTGRPGPPAAAPGNTGGIPVWPFLAIGAVLLAGGAWWALRRRPGRG